MPVELLEAVVRSGRYARTHAAQLGTLARLKGVKPYI